MTCSSCSRPACYSDAVCPTQITAVSRECCDAAGVQVSRLRCRITPIGNQEGCMSKVTRILTLAMLSMALVTAPVITAYANPDSDAPPPSSTKSKGKKKSSELKPSIEDAAFAKGYATAYATIYDRHDYASAIEQLKALGNDDIAAVPNLIRYSYPQHSDYTFSQLSHQPPYTPYP